MGTVECELKYSGVACGFIVAAALATGALAFATPLAVPLRVALIAGTAALACHALRAAARSGAVRIEPERRVQVRDGVAWRSGVLLDGCFVAPWLTVVRWRPDGCRLARAVLVVPDRVHPEQFRRLRVALRWS